MTEAISLLVGAPGSGKSTYALHVACAVAAGQDWGGQHVPIPRPTIYISAEDSKMETMRRLAATTAHLGIPENTLDNIHIVAGQTLRLGPRSGGGTPSQNMVHRILALIEKTGAGLVVIDPLIEVHDADENSNDAMGRVIADIRRIAQIGNTAVLLIHHSGKSQGGAGDQNLSRGASAINGAVRAIATLTHHTDEETITDNPGAEYVRFDIAKANYSAKGKSSVFRKETVELPNGDTVGVLTEKALSATEDRSIRSYDLEQISEAAANILTEKISINKLAAQVFAQNQELFPGISCSDQTRAPQRLRDLLKTAIRKHPTVGPKTMTIFDDVSAGPSGKTTFVDIAPPG